MSEWVQCHAMHLRVSWAVWPCWTYTVSCSAVNPPYSTLPSASTYTYMRINFIVQDDGGPDSHGFCFLNNISIGTYVRKNVRTYARAFVSVCHRMQSCFELCCWVSWVFYRDIFIRKEYFCWLCSVCDKAVCLFEDETICNHTHYLLHYILHLSWSQSSRSMGSQENLSQDISLHHFLFSSLLFSSDRCCLRLECAQGTRQEGRHRGLW